MIPSKLDQFSHYTRKEFEKIQEMIAPLVKKSSTYAFLSVPMFSFSVVNLYFLLFNSSQANQMLWIAIFAILGALGLALFKESIHKNREIFNKSVAYIKGRINKSDLITDDEKENYLNEIKHNPVNVFKVFQKFLSREERLKRMKEQILSNH
ncbi:DUF5392 family protein [Halalkalibacter krulwichiae]|uniref:YwnF n=1 Tax=Halalkalibacter krulwichiae TaxID=199441 RepID=A0A1X9MAN5_9BACI|nr:DUF5392 family protein [Halalkalibacter krulwichiae]ARK30505.1 hypothetical protein BkAM31D_12065 [Halalkalibacter krulwichiae]